MAWPACCSPKLWLQHGKVVLASLATMRTTRSPLTARVSKLVERSTSRTSVRSAKGVLALLILLLPPLQARLALSPIRYYIWWTWVKVRKQESEEPRSQRRRRRKVGWRKMVSQQGETPSSSPVSRRAGTAVGVAREEDHGESEIRGYCTLQRRSVVRLWKSTQSSHANVVSSPYGPLVHSLFLARVAPFLTIRLGAVVVLDDIRVLYSRIRFCSPAA